jgi:uncharacterized protein (TIGR02466 family)
MDIKKNQFLYNLLLSNNFRVGYYFCKLFSIFSLNYKTNLILFNFFKKRKKQYGYELIATLANPKIFIINVDIDNNDLVRKIYSDKKIYTKNEYSSDGHYNIYQSEHNINLDLNFRELVNLLSNILNNKILAYFSKSHYLEITKMWFVITKKLGIIKKHNHLASDLSGVLYLKIDEYPKNNEGALKIFNFNKHLDVYIFNSNKDSFEKKYICTDEFFYFNPKKNDLIIFNSFLEHTVNNSKKIEDRISIPFDTQFNDTR